MSTVHPDAEHAGIAEGAVEQRPAEPRAVSFTLGERQPLTQLEVQQAAEIETMYRTAPIGLALFDAVEFRYLRLNDRQAEFFGFPPEYLLGKTVTEMAPIPGVQELFEQVAAGTPVVAYPLEGELVGRPGEYRYWTVNYYPVYGEDGKVVAISAASLEITQQKKAEMALAQNERTAILGRLATSISHEINNPLEAVTNLLYLIGQDRALSAASRTHLEMAEQELARVGQIATQSLRFQRRSQEFVSISSAGLVDELVHLFDRKLILSRIDVTREFRTQAKIWVLENEIKQVLSNIVENAIDAMPEGGRLRFRVSDCVACGPYGSERDGVRITIADTGHGMSRTTLARIHEPFFTTKQMEGNGIGM
ncbi:two-component system sensor histidine kinase NtrB [Silvibacterium sp.]|uniref:two-component system sensor histidine kinase NtrB n=1 Tax=Silvibacterium sp. TaxID=1964179 RepID=UPI0039E354F1